MTKTKAQLSKFLAVLSASVLLGSTALGSIVFDNTSNNLNRVFSPGPGEFGDQVFLAGGDRRITDFFFEYFVSTNASGNETAEVFFYANDGGANGTEPGTRLFSSGSFSLNRGFNEVFAQGLSVTVPSTFTWTVRFAGVDLGETAGLLVFDPPTVGTSFDDFWVRSTDPTRPWSTFLIDNGAVPANFKARITAVPEPSTFAMLVLGGLALLGIRSYRRRA